MDVHPPHEPIHTWRDFLLHLLTITIGLLIALSLEAAVEAAHHRHLVHQARENLRVEIQGNVKLADRDLASLRDDRTRIQSDVQTLRDLRRQPRDFNGALHFNMFWSGFSDSAWRTARDTGALAFMPYENVQNFSELYTQQTYINTLGAALFTAQSRAPAPALAADSLSALTPAEVEELMRNTTELSVEIDALEELLRQFQASYREALNSL